jgi:hypothetical protein
MSILNQTLDFQQLPVEVKGAFPGNIASKVLLPAGTSLFRFSGHDRLSPWWSETAELGGLLLSAKASGKPLYQFVRDASAVLRRWHSNPMTNLIIGTLNQPVYAFRGIIGPQNEASIYMNVADRDNYKKKFTKPVFYRGGNGQVYINGLAFNDIKFIVPLGAVSIYDSVDEIIDFLVSYRLI